MSFILKTNGMNLRELTFKQANKPWTLLICTNSCRYVIVHRYNFIFIPTHRMMPGAYSFSVFRTCVRMYVFLYECVYVRTYVRT